MQARWRWRRYVACRSAACLLHLYMWVLTEVFACTCKLVCARVCVLCVPCAPCLWVRALLGSDRLAARDEADVYHAALTWLQAQAPPLGNDEAASILSLVRLPLLSRAFVRDTVRKEPLLCTNAGLRVVSDAFEAFWCGDASAACTRDGARVPTSSWLYLPSSQVHGGPHPRPSPRLVAYHSSRGRVEEALHAQVALSW